jgi:hypothetical protein
MKNVSWTWRSSGTEAIITPDSPPMMKTKKNPSTYRSGVSNDSRPVHNVAIQQKICTAVGTTIMMLEAVKKLCPSCGSPVANMWWTHTPKPMKAVAMSDSTRARYPNTERREKVAMIAEIIPSAGMKMM